MPKDMSAFQSTWDERRQTIGGLGRRGLGGSGSGRLGWDGRLKGRLDAVRVANLHAAAVITHCWVLWRKKSISKHTGSSPE